MKNTWIKVILVCAIIFVFELLCVVLYLRPYIISYSLHAAIKDGASERAQNAYERLDGEYKQAVDDNIDAFAASICQDYFDGKVSYEEAVGSLDAINSLEEGNETCKGYMGDISANELVKVINKLQEAELARDNNAIYQAENTLTKIILRMDNSTREDIMISLLKDKYRQYLDGELSAEGMKTYASCVSGMSYYSAYDLSLMLSDNVDCVEWYKTAYDKVEQLVDDENYIAALKLINSIDTDENDIVYTAKYKSLYETAYETGRIYYEELFEKYSGYNDNDSALALLAEISEVYGDTFDLDGLQQQVANDWQNAYIAFIDDWENRLRDELEGTGTGEYVLGDLYDTVWPDSICMYDVDDDGIPEMFLFNSARINDDYVECFMYHFNGYECEYLGYVNVISFCVNSNLLTFPTAFDRESGEEYALTAYDGDIIGIMTYCQAIGDEYYVDGEEATDYDYLSSKSDILQYQSRYNISNIDNSSLSEARSFILTYKN